MDILENEIVKKKMYEITMSVFPEDAKPKNEAAFYAGLKHVNGEDKLSLSFVTKFGMSGTNVAMIFFKKNGCVVSVPAIKGQKQINTMAVDLDFKKTLAEVSNDKEFLRDLLLSASADGERKAKLDEELIEDNQVNMDWAVSEERREYYRAKIENIKEDQKVNAKKRMDLGKFINDKLKRLSMSGSEPGEE